eukprot:scaffold7033_cov257-Pinguiococcus_pyrenoidosus.AAC.29
MCISCPTLGHSVTFGVRSSSAFFFSAKRILCSAPFSASQAQLRRPAQRRAPNTKHTATGEASAYRKQRPQDRRKRRDAPRHVRAAGFHSGSRRIQQAQVASAKLASKVGCLPGAYVSQLAHAALAAGQHRRDLAGVYVRVRARTAIVLHHMQLLKGDAVHQGAGVEALARGVVDLVAALPFQILQPRAQKHRRTRSVAKHDVCADQRVLRLQSQRVFLL